MCHVELFACFCLNHESDFKQEMTGDYHRCFEGYHARHALKVRVIMYQSHIGGSALDWRDASLQSPHE